MVIGEVKAQRYGYEDYVVVLRVEGKFKDHGRDVKEPLIHLTFSLDGELQETRLIDDMWATDHEFSKAQKEIIANWIEENNVPDLMQKEKEKREDIEKQRKEIHKELDALIHREIDIEWAKSDPKGFLEDEEKKRERTNELFGLLETVKYQLRRGIEK